MISGVSAHWRAPGLLLTLCPRTHGSLLRLSREAVDDDVAVDAVMYVCLLMISRLVV